MGDVLAALMVGSMAVKLDDWSAVLKVSSLVVRRVVVTVDLLVVN